jgi:hypothetical protein
LQCGRRLERAQIPHDRGTVAHVGLREAIAQLPDELKLAREPAVPRAQCHRRLQRVEFLVAVLPAQFLWLEHRVDGTAAIDEAGEMRAELAGRHHTFDPGVLGRLADQIERNRLAIRGGLVDSSGSGPERGLRPRGRQPCPSSAGEWRHPRREQRPGPDSREDARRFQHHRHP